MQTHPNCKKFPFDDEIMKYDYVNHRYVLTQEGVLARQFIPGLGYCLKYAGQLIL